MSAAKNIHGFLSPLKVNVWIIKAVIHGVFGNFESLWMTDLNDLAVQLCGTEKLLKKGEEHKEKCLSPQYLEQGQTGVVQCVFRKGFYGVHWYDSEDVSTTPIISLQESAKEGEGYLAGEFDIASNGSLIIQNVSIRHEHTFTVMMFKSTTDLPNFFSVRVITIVKAKPPHPIIYGCDDETDVCFQGVNEDYQVSCSVSNARPAVPLRWKVKTALGDMNISTLATVSNRSLTQTSRAFTKQIFQYSDLLALLVCKSDVQARGLDETDAHVLFFNSRKECSALKTENHKYFKLNTEIVLECGKEGSGYPLIVWSRLHDGLCEHLLYAVFFEESFVKTIVSNYELSNRSSLVVPHAELQHEGPYFCVFGNGHTEGIVRRDISVYVNPNPPYPVVDGCNHGQYCILEARREGDLKCSVYGIRPNVDLEWRSLHGHKQPSISFHRPNLTVVKKGETFNVELNTRYRLERRYANRLTIECIVSGQNANIFNISTKIDLVFETEDPRGDSQQISPALPVALIMIGSIVLLCVCGFIVYKVHHYQRTRSKRLKSLEEKHNASPEGENMQMIAKPKEDETDSDSLDEYIPDDEEVTEESKYYRSLLGRRKVEMIKISYTLPINEHIQRSSDTDDIFIAILGKTGVGKSATANCIFGRHVFKEELDSAPVTTKSTFHSQTIDGRVVNIVDTPGLDDSNVLIDDDMREISRIFAFFSLGVDVLVFVSNIADMNRVDEDLRALETIERKFGGSIYKALLLVLSHAEYTLDEEVSLEQFCKTQEERDESFSTFLNRFGKMVVAVNNRSNLPAEKKRNQNVLLSMIDAIRKQNEYSLLEARN